VSVRPEKRFVDFCFGFFLLVAKGLFAHAATGLTAVLAKTAIRTGVFLQKNYFSHIYSVTRKQRFLQVHAQKSSPHFLLIE
jgi:hypothetical protein